RTLPFASITYQSRLTSCGLATKVFMMVPNYKRISPAEHPRITGPFPGMPAALYGAARVSRFAKALFPARAKPNLYPEKPCILTHEAWNSTAKKNRRRKLVAFLRRSGARTAVRTLFKLASAYLRWAARAAAR